MNTPNIVIDYLGMLCVKYRKILVELNVWQIDTLLGCLWDDKYYSNAPTTVLSEGTPIDSTEVEVLLEELRVVYCRLEEIGISKEMARKMLWERERVSNIVVQQNGTISFPDYHIVLNLTPLQWSLYLLFLRHEEGIVYKNLTDYRDELLQILKEFMSRNRVMVHVERLNRIVDRLTDPCGSCINETVSKIKRAFIVAIGHEELARHYYINGVRRGVKRIPLDRSFVTIDIP